jgi:hypothetical protein
MDLFRRNAILIVSCLVALIISNAACTRPSIPVAPEPHPPRLPATAAFGSAIFRVGKSVTYSDGLTVELKGINDSRCPAKVQCIWQGELAANFTAHGGDLGNQARTFTLGAVTAKHQVVAAYDFVLADASVDTATVIVTKPGVDGH